MKIRRIDGNPWDFSVYQSQDGSYVLKVLFTEGPYKMDIERYFLVGSLDGQEMTGDSLKATAALIRERYPEGEYPEIQNADLTVHRLEIPVSGAMAQYRGRQLPIAFSSNDWVALQTGAEVEIPDAIAYGERRSGQSWAKVPRAVLDGIVQLRVTGKIAGATVSLQRRMPDGRISVSFIGSPAVARQIGLQGDQHMGWSGLFDPVDFEDIEVTETRRV